MSNIEGIKPTERVEEFVKHSQKYKAKGHRGALNQGGPSVRDPRQQRKKRANG